MKKVLSASLCLILALATFAGCGNGGGAAVNAGGSGSSAAAGPEFTIRFAHIENELTGTAQGVRVWQRYVEENSGGRIAVNVLGAGALGSEREILEATIMGTIEGGMAMSSLFTTYQPNWDIIDLPFTFSDRDDLVAKLRGEMGDILRADAEELGIKVLNFFDAGFRVISNNQRPIEDISDFNGMLNRVPESTLLIETHTALGGSPTPMAFGEVYTALQLGTIDGVETAAIYVQDGNFQEVTSYTTLTNHSANVQITFLNQAFFDSLPPDLQEVINDATERAVDAQRQIAIEADELALEAIAAAGVAINTPSPELVAQMRSATAGVIDSYRDRIDPRLIALAGF